MTRHDRRTRMLAIALAGVAGFVDAIGFIASGGFFVSFMSGNTTRAGVGLAEGSLAAGGAAGLIGLFVAGVMAGTALGRRTEAAGRRVTAVLCLVTVLLMAAGGLWLAGLPLGALAMLALAMGAENAAFEREGEVSIGVTYMTGALVKMGQHLTTALSGGPRWGWVPYGLLWAALATGAACGAAAFLQVGPAALGVAVAGAAGLTALAAVWRR